MTKFSIITVAYNSAETIALTIASVQRQRGADVEYIIVDGGSSDGTLELVSRLAPEARLSSERDDGIFDAMNKGIRSASGDVVALLNSDDHYAHDSVLETVARLLDDPSVDAVFGDVGFFNADTPGKITRRYRARDFKPSRVKNGLAPPHPAMFLRRSVYNKFGLYDPRYKLVGDFELVARIFAQGGISYMVSDDLMVMMQTGGASTSGLKSKMIIQQESIRACRANGIAANHLTMLGKYPLKLRQFVRH